MLMEAEFWVALGFFVFLGLLGYLGIHRMIGKSLDERAARIKAELDEAKKLKDEAAALLADYRRKRDEAEGEAQEIVAGAKAEAERLAAEAKVRIEEFVSRRTKMAEVKIAQAEAQAAADVRSAAAEAAVAAAAKVLGQETKGKLAADLIAKGIEDVRDKLIPFEPVKFQLFPTPATPEIPPIFHPAPLPHLPPGEVEGGGG
jgi:F-type H+-transporting ATPase subunit b